MSHMIETMAYAGEVPWHGLGVKVLGDLTPEQMLEKAQLNWTVEKVPVTYMYKGDQHATGKQALIRGTDGKLLDVITDDWNPLQNAEAFDFFNDFVMNGDMEMHTAGSLKGGQIVWALAKVKDGFTIFKGDSVDSYLMFSNPHQFGKSINIVLTPIRVVCWNTHQMALGGVVDKIIKVNHRRKFDAEEVKRTMGIAHKKLEEYKETALFIGSKRFSKETLVEYFDTVFPSLSKKGKEQSRAAVEAMTVIEKQPGSQFAEGTWWQAYNTVTFMADHLLGRSNDTRLQSAWFGANRQKKVEALEQAIEFAKAS